MTNPNTLDSAITENFSTLKNYIPTLISSGELSGTDNASTDAIYKRFDCVHPLELTTEGEFDVWVDTFLATAKRTKVEGGELLSVFLSKISATLTAYTNSDESLLPADSIEDYLNKLGKLLFPNSVEHEILADSILIPPRATSVAEASITLNQNLQRYCRLLARHNNKCAVTDDRIRLSFLRSIPTEVEEHLRLHHTSDPLPTLMTIARSCEDRLVKRRTAYSAHAALPHGLDMSLDQLQAERKERINTPDHYPPSNSLQSCHGCNGDHLRKDCPFAKYRCRSCHLIGHISRACRNPTTKDSHGRLRTRFVETPSGTNVHYAKDRSLRDHSYTVASAMNDINKRTIRDAETRRKSYLKKNPDAVPQKPLPAFTSTTPPVQMKNCRSHSSEDTLSL
eukprot:GHVH01014950.1.p1 GENE.GHVH01014950.1~~GHVH01014950.1.p1  ORF type:complete len:395 (+),score=29.56 GHVH01014950.1:128-1312(+)